MLRRLLVGLAAVFGLSSCAAAPARPPNPQWAAIQHDPKSFVARVSELRGLPERRPTPIIFHSEASFAEAVRRKAEQDKIGPTPADYIPFQVAFGLVIPTESGGHLPTSLGAVQRSEIVAFYDEVSHSVHVKRAPGDDEELPFVVAHEIGHSLQEQHFRVPNVATVTDEDTRLALMALMEGDAMLAMLAYGADLNHVPLTRALVRIARGASEATVENYDQKVNSSRALSSAPPFIRERLSFPYLSGATFLGSLFRAGGYGLVNRVYDVPPVSTEQILHPEKYLAGELPVPVRAPELPQGHELIVSGHLGELMTRSMLQICNKKGASEAAAAGWGGDSFAITRIGNQGTLLFSTIWDSVEDAREFENAMRRTAACWDRFPGPLKQIFPPGTAVARVKDRVLVVRGLPPAPAKLAFKSLGELPSPRIESRPPFGPIVIPPPRVATKVRPPFLANGHIMSQYLGLSIPLPQGFEPELGEEILLSRESPSMATMLFGISDWVFSTETIELSFQQFAKGLHNKLDPEQRLVVVEADSRVQTPVGQAIQRVWQVEGTTFRGRLLLVPICRNTGALVIAQGYADEHAQRSLEWVLAGIRPLNAASPLCAELDP